ncbi:OmpH family outer membrane protein [Desulforhopalus vacuolatus]|uniref:OmpH family outer membrane protein n=1 Tax=Desulforhopalus vacuolatus TaxID=40414 RepID=UPI0019642E11|nr:OmpH family outer membrane protein [Desulforhopalus vacuolatus]MBM9520138.1 OmpH family outer membrane protein [Desulforhopalus vacuolatus]
MRIHNFFAAAIVVVTLACFSGSAFAAAATKIGVIDVQKILLNSKAGSKATKSLDAKMASYKDKFKGESEKLRALQTEIKKKSSAWSEETKKAKLHDFEKAARALQQKTKDAEFEMKQARDKELAPLFKTLQGVLDSYGQKKGFAVIIEKMPGIPFVNPANDITDEITKAFNKVSN